MIRAYAINLIGEATDGNPSYMEDLSDREDIELEDVIDLLRNARIPLAAPLRADLDQIFEGEEPKYFLRPDRIVELYREHHHPYEDFSEPDHGIRPLFTEETVRQFKEEIAQVKSFGVSLTPYRDGAACVAEQRFFYTTDEWKNRASVLKIIDRFTCGECGRHGRDLELHAHHGEYIYSVFSRKCHRNFEVGRLRCLCERCHKQFHETHVRGHGHFAVGSAEDLARHSKHRADLERLHDSLRECRFCFSGNQRKQISNYN